MPINIIVTKCFSTEKKVNYALLILKVYILYE